MPYLSFTQSVKKTECPPGQHAHFGSGGKCHPIDKPHKPGTGADRWHREHGLVTADDKDKPKEEKETNEKKEENESKVEPYEDGIAKPESLKYVMGVTRRAILKDHPEYFEQAKETAKSVRDKLNDDSLWSDDSHTTAWKIKETLEPFKEYGDIEVSDKLKNIPIPAMKSILSDFADTFEEYPYAMASFGGFTTINENSDAIMWCSYQEDRQIGIKASDFTSLEDADKNVENVYFLRDPIAKGERTPWGFHFKGSTHHSSISHEWGHACDIALFSLKVNIIKGEKDSLPISIYDRSSIQNLEYSTEEGKKIRSDFKDMGYNIFISPRNGYASADASVSLIDTYTPQGVDRDKVEEYLKGKGYSMKNVTGHWGNLDFEIVPADDTPVLNLDRLEYTDRKDLRTKSRIASRQKKSLWKDMGRVSKQRVNECEEMYKEIYGMKVLPSECYTRYGYYGAGRPNRAYFSEEKANLTESASSERLAEAMEDVMVRKDKANSMSQLLVAHLEFEYYQIITGRYDLSFKDFIKNEVGLDRFKDRIIKSSPRFLLFNAIAKRCPNGKRFDDETNTCIPKEEWEAKHHHDYSKPKEEKPKRKDDIANQSFIKVKKGSKEWKMVQNLKVGDSEEAKASRKAVIDFYNKHGWIPRIEIEPFEINGETFDGTKTTYTKFTDENGDYTPERLKVHDKIVDRLLSQLPKPEGRKPIVLFTGGGSASGKGSMDSILAEKMGITVNMPKRKEGESDDEYNKRQWGAYSSALAKYKIDPDAIMEMLPEYEEYVKHDMIGGASVFHKEASDIAKRIYDTALRMGADFIYDGTFSSEKSLRWAKDIDRDRYDIHLVGKLTDVDICKDRSGRRFINGGKDGRFPRIVPNSVLEKSNAGFRKIIKDNDMDSIFDSFTTVEDAENKK